MYKRSCALTLSSHHKKRGHKWAFKKYGQDLKIEYDLKSGKTSSVNLEIPSLSGGGRLKKKSGKLRLSLFNITRHGCSRKLLTKNIIIDNASVRC
jgi:hypothetical protein